MQRSPQGFWILVIEALNLTSLTEFRFHLLADSMIKANDPVIFCLKVVKKTHHAHPRYKSSAIMTVPEPSPLLKIHSSAVEALAAANCPVTGIQISVPDTYLIIRDAVKSGCLRMGLALHQTKPL